MEIAAIILATISLIMSMASLTWLLAKHFSSHNIQMVPIDPFKDGMPQEMGKKIFDEFRDLGDPVDQDELDRLNKKIIND